METIKQTQLDILRTRHEEINKEEPAIKRLCDELSFINQFIKNFFSEFGEAEGIKNMYKAINDDRNSHKVIICSDVFTASEIYKEYMKGMIQFIKDINDTNSLYNDDKLESFHEKFLIAKKNDLEFIKSLYNGKIAEKREVDLQTAVVNIEYLIDLIPGMESMNHSCTSINEFCQKSTDKSKQELIQDSLNMLFDSVSNYCYYATKEVIETYVNIQCIINNDDSQEQTGFKLF